MLEGLGFTVIWKWTKSHLFGLSSAARARSMTPSSRLCVQRAPVESRHLKWVAKRHRDSSLNVNKAEQRLTNRPLRIREAPRKMKEKTTKRNTVMYAVTSSTNTF